MNKGMKLQRLVEWVNEKGTNRAVDINIDVREGLSIWVYDYDLSVGAHINPNIDSIPDLKVIKAKKLREEMEKAQKELLGYDEDYINEEELMQQQNLGTAHYDLNEFCEEF